MRSEWWLGCVIILGVIILGIMMSVPTIDGPKGKAKIQITRSLVSGTGPIAAALDQFKRDEGHYPKELIELAHVPIAAEVTAAKWRGPYIQNPDDLKDAWGHPMNYRYPGRRHLDSYDLWSVGPDGESGTDDDISNSSIR
jgi:general secretion pathway protein G